MTNNNGSPDPMGFTDPAVELLQRVSMTLGTGTDPSNRRIFLVGEVDEETLYRFLVAFTTLDATDGAIQIVMASPGGSEPCGWAIYDAIKLARNTVIIDGYGAVYSIAALILQAGSYRRLTPNCRFMIHNGSVLINGGINSNEAVGMGKEVEKNSIRYAKALQERSPLTLKQVEEMCRAETFLSAEETIQAGFADGTVPFSGPTQKKKGKKAKNG